MKKLLQIVSYILVAAVASCVTLAFCLQRPDVLSAAPASDWSKLDELKALIDEKFIGEADATAMADGAATGLVDSLGDRWSYYIPASEYSAYQEQMANAYVGIGITIVLRDDGLLDVTKVNPGSPALEAGMQPGDVIAAVEGQSVAQLGLDGTKNAIRGEEGTTVNITVEREGEKIDMTVTRRTIQTEVAAAEMLDGNIGLVTIVNFDSRCYSETVAAIESLLEQGATALIFDVRFNPGGYKHELVQVLDYLLPEGVLFRSLEYTGAEFVDESDENCLDIPMAVLVNGDSFSAAEFFAAALDEYDAAVVVGQPTSGKGHYQNTFQLTDGSAVGLSVGKYFTPKGVSLEGVGITPEVLVEIDQELMARIYSGLVEPADDPQIQAAVKALQE